MKNIVRGWPLVLFCSVACNSDAGRSQEQRQTVASAVPARGDVEKRPAIQQPIPAGMVELTTHSRLRVQLVYATTQNVTGRPLEGYQSNGRCVLRKDTADAVIAAARDLSESRPALGILLWDCYRPQVAVDDLLAWTQMPTDETLKSQYFPSIDKRQLVNAGYIAERSSHTKGTAIDATLVEWSTGTPLDMGTRHDYFDKLAGNKGKITNLQRANRRLLQSVLHDFRPYAREWWHFSLTNE